jgi:transcriptional regulator with XRE-family HTH domain
MEELTAKQAADIGRNVRARRLANQLSQAAVASELGLSFGFISKVERGRMRRVTTDLLRLQRFLGLQVNEDDSERPDNGPVTIPVSFHAISSSGRGDYELVLTTRDDVARLDHATAYEVTLRGTAVTRLGEERWERRIRCRIQYPIAATIRILPERSGELA